MDWVRLGDIVDIKTGKLNANAAVENGKYPFFTTAEQISRIDTYSYDDEVVLVAGNGDLNVKYYKGKFDAYQRTYILTLKKDQKYLTKYIYYFMSSYIRILRDQSIGGVIKYIKLENLTEAKIPDISLDEQEKIINLFEKLEKLIKIRQDQIQALDDLIDSSFYQMFGGFEYEKIRLKNLIKFKNKNIKDFENYSNYYYLGVEDIEKNTGKILSKSKVSEVDIKSGKKIFSNDDVLYSRIRPNLNKVAIPDFNGLISSEVYVIECKNKINKYFLTHILRSQRFVQYAILNSTGANFPRVSQNAIESYNIPLPPIEKQNKFADLVTKIEGQKGILEDSLSELSDLFASLMQDAFDGSLSK